MNIDLEQIEGECILWFRVEGCVLPGIVSLENTLNHPYICGDLLMRKSCNSL